MATFSTAKSGREIRRYHGLIPNPITSKICRAHRQSSQVAALRLRHNTRISANDTAAAYMRLTDVFSGFDKGVVTSNSMHPPTMTSDCSKEAKMSFLKKEFMNYKTQATL